MRIPALIAILCLSVIPSKAQSYPPLEIFGGYSFMNFDSGDRTGKVGTLHMNGWEASVTGNFTRLLGVEGDVSGHYVTNCLGATTFDCWRHAFSIGPRLSLRHDRASGFVHGLFGTEQATIPASLIGAGAGTVKDVSFIAGFGGGLDVHVTGPFSVRVIQFDYTTSHHFEVVLDRQHSVRASAGIVIALGR